MNSNLIMKIKKLNKTAKLPTKGTEGAACFDLYASETVDLLRGRPTKIPTGLAFEIPDGYCLTIYGRSSSALKSLVIVPQIVDSDYRGEVFILVNRLGSLGDLTYRVNAGDRIAQFKLEKIESVTFELVEELSDTQRGTGGFGSSGI